MFSANLFNHFQKDKRAATVPLETEGNRAQSLLRIAGFPFAVIRLLDPRVADAGTF
jgi:hypothetical protein